MRSSNSASGRPFFQFLSKKSDFFFFLLFTFYFLKLTLKYPGVSAFKKKSNRSLNASGANFKVLMIWKNPSVFLSVKI